MRRPRAVPHDKHVNERATELEMPGYISRVRQPGEGAEG